MPTPALSGVHHIKLPVADLARSRDWYTSVLGLQITREFEDDDGVIRGLAGMLTDPAERTVLALALRQNPEAAAGISGFDPLALAVPNHAALQAWKEHVTRQGWPPPDINPDGTVLLLHDPDGLEIRLFSPQHHDGGTPPPAPATFVNIFEIPTEDVEAFIIGWHQRAELLSSAPGFRDAELLQATTPETRFQLINIAHWDSYEAWHAATSNPQFQQSVRAVGNDPQQRATPNIGFYDPVARFDATNQR
jgi:catechol 2,3-dioxygenase-like lactoylglutathione lyase family enzyme